MSRPSVTKFMGKFPFLCTLIPKNCQNNPIFCSWMAARGDLEDEKVKKEYERGYQVLLGFYHEHL